MDNPEFLWQQRGWTRNRDGKGKWKFSGYYLPTSPQKTPGRILVNERVTPPEIRAFIYAPPPSLKNHPQGSCFSHFANEWFGVHWEKSPSTVDDALAFMENVLQWCLTNS